MAAKRKAVVAEAKAPAVPVEAKRPPGRQSSYVAEVAAEIIDRLTTGEPLLSICRDSRMPPVRTVYNWERDIPEFTAEFARARQLGYDAIAHDCLNIADDNGRDMRITDKDEMVTDHDVIQRAKLRVDTRLKLLACWDPKRFGPKIDIDQTTRTVPMTDEQLAEEMRQSPAYRRQIERMLAMAAE